MHPRTSLTVALVACFPLALPGAHAARAGCGTVVPAGPVVGQTWTAAGSPYCVQGDVTVSGLTIEPGVVVRCAPDVTIQVSVALDAEGTADAPVVFESENPADPWSGLTFVNVPPGSRLVHCHVRGAEDSGLKLIDSAPLVESCLFVENTTAQSTVGGVGAAVYALYQSAQSLTLTDCTFADNRATGSGGGLSVQLAGGTLFLEGCTVSGNVAGVDLPTVSVYGGGVHVQGDALLVDCRVEDNVAQACAPTSSTRYSYGGGLAAVGGDCTVQSTTFRGNLAYTENCGTLSNRRARGGGVYVAAGTLLLEGVLVGCNEASAGNEQSGAGVYVASDATAEVRNATLARNVGSGAGLFNAGGVVNVDSSILYNNDSLGGCQYGPQSVGTIGFTYCCVQEPVAPPGAGNFNFNPAFADSACEGGCGCEALTLLQFSPCLDAGNPARPDACFPLHPGNGADTATNNVGFQGGALSCDAREDRYGAGLGTVFCFGNGQGAACPCSSSSRDEGCLHSGGVGMTIRALGTPRVSADDLTVVASRCPAGNTGIFYCGSVALNGGAGVPLFDGIQCTGGNVRRFQGRFQANGSVCDTGFVAQDPSGVYFVPGSTYHFQYWSRDVASACGALSNFSPAVRLVLVP